MPKTELTNGYVCYPYNNDRVSIRVKELWEKSRNIDSMFFVAATFSNNGKAYFINSYNHYLLARFKNHKILSNEISNYKQNIESFVFNIDDDLFEREACGSMNFVSVYYLEYGESGDDIVEIANVIAKQEKIARASVGCVDIYCTIPPKFTFPFSDNIVVLEVSGEKNHQSIKKYCEKTRSHVNRRGYSMTNLVGFSILEKLK